MGFITLKIVLFFGAEKRKFKNMIIRNCTSGPNLKVISSNNLVNRRQSTVHRSISSTSNLIFHGYQKLSEYLQSRVIEHFRILTVGS